MGVSDNVAVVALIVSLIALLIALLQLSQQILGTADGYRRCARSVIDDWHKLRNRVRNWSEFRLETWYTTPQILLVTPGEFEVATETQVIYYVNPPSLSDAGTTHTQPEELVNTVHKGIEPRSQPSANAAQRNVGNVNKADEEKGDATRLSHNISRVPPFASRKEKQNMNADKELLVTWLKLLKDIHSLYYSYRPDDCKFCTKNDIATGWSLVDMFHASDKCQLDRHDHSDTSLVPLSGPLSSSGTRIAPNLARSDVAVKYKRWNWDFMPPDIVRPLAESNVGDFVILMHRMGLTWSTLDLERSRMQAEGNGYSISSTDAPGLGIIIKFSAIGRHDRFPRVIPSRAADKLLCGIIPGCPDLIGRDFDLVRRDGQLRRVHELGGILSKIGTPDFNRRKIEDKDYEETHNDTIILLCPFLPLEHSTIARYSFNCFRPGPHGKRTVFGYWEGRHGLLEELRKRTEVRQDCGNHADLLKAYNSLDDLRRRFAHDFYRRMGRAAINNQQGAQKKEELMDACRQIFATTMAYFQDPHQIKDSEDRDVPTRYMHLIAAHTCMANQAINNTNQMYDRVGWQKRYDELAKEHRSILKEGNALAPKMIDHARNYVKMWDNPEDGIPQYLEKQGIRIEKDEIEVMWWNLMLRGIVWDLGSFADTNSSKRIPSFFYGNKTPIWIT